MDFRKLICFGKGSYVISLPKDWVNKHKLKKGSVLSLEAYDGSMTISTNLAEEAIEKKTAAIACDNKPIEEITTEIITAYLTGYDIIDLISKNIREIDQQLKEAIMNLAGMEILEQTATKITAKFLLDIREVSFDSLVRRMDNITRSLIIDAVECIKGACNYLSIKQRDNDVNRLNFLVMRTVRATMDSYKQLKSMGKSIWQLYTYIVIAEKLEKISDRQKRIARCLERLKLSKNFAEELRKVYKGIGDSYLEVMKSYYQNDKKIALQIELSNRARIGACDKLLGKDINKEYKMIRHESKDKLTVHIHEHMIMTEIISDLKAMATSVKLIARIVLNGDGLNSPQK